jgi:hypothetical protein
MSEITERNYRWFKEHLCHLVKKYSDKFIVVKDQKVIGAYDTFAAAFEETKFKEKPGEYIIQLCSMDESKTTAKFYSQVTFS